MYIIFSFICVCVCVCDARHHKDTSKNMKKRYERSSGVPFDTFVIPDIHPLLSSKFSSLQVIAPTSLYYISVSLHRVCVCVRACVHACVHACVRVCVCVHGCRCMQGTWKVYVRACMQACVCVCTCVKQHSFWLPFQNKRLRTRQSSFPARLKRKDAELS